LRVANRPPFTLAIAAIIPSGADMTWPCLDAVPMISPYSIAASSVRPYIRSATLPPTIEAMLQTAGALIRHNFLDAIGDFGDRNRRECKLAS
jgi:hypothetical protein